jgi:hypothetical protein
MGEVGGNLPPEKVQSAFPDQKILEALRQFPEFTIKTNDQIILNNLAGYFADIHNIQILTDGSGAQVLGVTRIPSHYRLSLTDDERKEQTAKYIRENGGLLLPVGFTAILPVTDSIPSRLTMTGLYIGKFYTFKMILMNNMPQSTDELAKKLDAYQEEVISFDRHRSEFTLSKKRRKGLPFIRMAKREVNTYAYWGSIENDMKNFNVYVSLNITGGDDEGKPKKRKGESTDTQWFGLGSPAPQPI